MMNVFSVCPEYETGHFKIRKLKAEDVDELFLCYSDPEAARFFNGDCCGDDFYYIDKDKFRECVEYWLSRYEAQDFVRWSIHIPRQTLIQSKRIPKKRVPHQKVCIPASHFHIPDPYHPK